MWVEPMSKSQLTQEREQPRTARQGLTANRGHRGTNYVVVSPLLALQNHMWNAAIQRLLSQCTTTDLMALDITIAKSGRHFTESAQREQQAASATAQSQPEAQWLAHPGIHRYFRNQQNYVALLPFYQARGITNPAHYVQTNIVQVRFLGMSTPAHRDMLAPLAAAENVLREQDVIPNISRFWSFNPRLSASGTLSQHAVGRAVDINAAENPHVRHPIDIQVIAAVAGVDLGQRQNPEDMRRASTTFQRDFTQDWVAQQPENLQRHIRQRRQVLDRYAQNGFLNLEQSLIDALTGAGFTWGGAWNRSKDFMHFELGW